MSNKSGEMLANHKKRFWKHISALLLQKLVDSTRGNPAVAKSRSGNPSKAMLKTYLLTLLLRQGSDLKLPGLQRLMAQ